MRTFFIVLCGIGAFSCSGAAGYAQAVWEVRQNAPLAVQGDPRTSILLGALFGIGFLLGAVLLAYGAGKK